MEGLTKEEQQEFTRVNCFERIDLSNLEQREVCHLIKTAA